MAVAYITEYSGTAPQAGTTNPVPLEPALRITKHTYSTTTSLTLTARTTLVRLLNSSSAFHYVIVPPAGTATATANSTQLPSNTVEYVGVVQGGCVIALYDGAS